MSFTQFLIRRLLYVLPTIFLVTVAVFSILQLVPGDPVDALLQEGMQDEEMRAILNKQYGFDKPIYIQYTRWMSRVMRGDLGDSILHGRPVATILKDALPRTVYLAVAAMSLAVTLSFPLGIFAAVKRKTWIDYTAQVTALLGLSVPGFWAALMLMLYFGLMLGWFPVVGYTPPSENFWSFLHHLFLPAFTLGLEMVAVQTRMTRSTMLDELNKDYVQTHQAQGLPERTIIARYTLKNAMIPTLTIVSIRFAALLGGTVVIESVFAWPGIGLTIYDGIMTKDFPVVQGGILVLSFSFIFINLLVDIAYKWLDPRITLE
ncbi:MAG: ABC transporter permease [Deltaproteobacteria bacterium]|nr:ABC transporter permease [Deltaproteobacteria bacterium]MBW2051126.1 ABC transporter permease [Deltaproteobacteria bacterium]MBW2140722.1 ABC transporter permease [Deltaproteobacteria bacterium]MBW2322859.1 ABC transporter permease [Deltaproteobacteria bacterium]